ncbi:MAG: hypothetical protein OXE74_00040 [Cyanobacteria bacterium MAG CAR2_bin_4]|nr:hypothetical protein [Cyanobacteria bacterium MAG CAR2_bin_4]
MSLAAGLLQQAKDLLAQDPRKPRQVNLRRAVSTDYYSLFSLLVEEAAGIMVGGGQGKKLLRGYVIRAFSHRGMADVCRGFARKNPSQRIWEVLAGCEISDNLASVAATFAIFEICAMRLTTILFIASPKQKPRILLMKLRKLTKNGIISNRMK